jgi:arylsulfatase A-like enzyme
MVKRLDEAFGRLMDTLRSLNLRDNTIVLFTSDHGCHFKTRNSEYKRSCHDASLRVPTLLAGPGFRGGGQVHDLVSLVDLPPTLLDAAGIAQQRPMQGRSILPLLRGQRDDWPREVFAQISESKIARCIRTHRWKYEVTSPDSNLDQPGSRRYIESALYDMENDPYELDNLVGHPAVRALCDRLMARLIDRMAAAGEPIPTVEPVTNPGRPQHALSEAELSA